MNALFYPRRQQISCIYIESLNDDPYVYILRLRGGIEIEMHVLQPAPMPVVPSDDIVPHVVPNADPVVSVVPNADPVSPYCGSRIFLSNFIGAFSKGLIQCDFIHVKYDIDYWYFIFLFLS